MPERPKPEDVRVITDATNRIYRFNFEHANDASIPTLPSHCLFHYTNADGLKGIIESNELWATSAYFLNDSTEIIYGYGILDEALKDWIAVNPRPEGSLSLKLALELQKEFAGDLLSRNVMHAIYLVCLCEEDNLLSQWRAYGQAGGYSLGFTLPVTGAARGVKPEPCIYTAKLVKVEYEREKQLSRCRAIIAELLPIFDDPALPNALDTVDTNSVFGYSTIRNAVAEILSEEIMGFKNKAFEVEKEWRLVVRQRDLLKQGTDDGGKTPVPVHFRSSKGMIVPYVKLVPTEQGAKLPLTCVRSGPTLDKVTAWLGAWMLLRKHEFRGVSIEGSDIPVKF
ncbi:MAG: DUF2971 domain-containing protein [Candidatus Korobacteraceae bacterium]